MKFRQYVTQIALVLFVSACTPIESVTYLSIANIQTGSQSNVRKSRFTVIVEPDSFSRHYSEIHSNEFLPPAMPKINFETHIVLVAYLGLHTTGGHIVGFSDRAKIEKNVATVQVFHSSPSKSDIVPSVLTTPFAIATMPRGTYSKVLFLSAENKEIGQVSIPYSND